MIKTACPTCHRKINAGDKLFGSTVNCPACRFPFTVGNSITDPFNYIDQTEPTNIVPKYKQRKKLRNKIILLSFLILALVVVCFNFSTATSVVGLNHSGVLFDYLKSKANDPTGLEIVNISQVESRHGGDYSCVNVNFRTRNHLGALQMMHGQAHIHLGRVEFFIVKNFIRSNTPDLIDLDSEVLQVMSEHMSVEEMNTWVANRDKK